MSLRIVVDPLEILLIALFNWEAEQLKDLVGVVSPDSFFNLTEKARFALHDHEYFCRWIHISIPYVHWLDVRNDVAAGYESPIE